jgi:hypothetical protein
VAAAAPHKAASQQQQKQQQQQQQQQQQKQKQKQQLKVCFGARKTLSEGVTSGIEAQSESFQRESGRVTNSIWGCAGSAPWLIAGALDFFTSNDKAGCFSSGRRRLFKIWVGSFPGTPMEVRRIAFDTTSCMSSVRAALVGHTIYMENKCLGIGRSLLLCGLDNFLQIMLQPFLYRNV